MPDDPLVPLGALMDLLHDRSDVSAEAVRDKLKAMAASAKRASAELGYMMLRHRVDPDRIPPVGLFLDELADAMSKPPLEDRFPLPIQPTGALLSLRPAKTRRRSV